jgi:hypothetical protein
VILDHLLVRGRGSSGITDSPAGDGVVLLHVRRDTMCAICGLGFSSPFHIGFPAALASVSGSAGRQLLVEVT